jgi:predicted Rossmann fold flavoprotein
MKKIIVIGAGASGMLAAGTAAEKGAEVLIIEKKKREGIKLSITGKGRCNITNIVSISEFIEHFGKKGKFLRQSFNYFFSGETIKFFNCIGVETIKERGGRIFTKNGDAKEVVFCLLKWLKKNNVKIIKEEKVEKLIIKKNKVIGILTKKKKEEKKYFADSVIMATGGKSYPQTGSTGDGYKIAKKEGHKINELKQALVPLRTDILINKKLKDLKLKNINVSLFIDNKKKKEEFGEVYFYEKGITGPVILSLSKKIVEEKKKKKKIKLKLDLKPGLDENKLDKRIIRDLEKFGNKNIEDILKEIIPVNIIELFIERTKIDPLKKGNIINLKERTKIKENIKRFEINIEGYASFEEAIITSGGISTKEICPNTMESKIVKDLYFCGEIIDIDADTGGYNLQAAFSTGRVAGKNCVK